MIVEEEEEGVACTDGETSKAPKYAKVHGINGGMAIPLQGLSGLEYVGVK